MRQHVGLLVLFFALSDAMLIFLGVGGVAPFMAQWLQRSNNGYLRGGDVAGFMG